MRRLTISVVLGALVSGFAIANDPAAGQQVIYVDATGGAVAQMREGGE